MDYHHYLCSTMTNKYAGEITKDINSTDDNDTDVEKHIKHFQEQIDKMQAMMEETKDNVDKLVATLDNQEKQSILDVDVLQHGEI
jgi:peptidoglycan hydrolase CwlO-like protein